MTNHSTARGTGHGSLRRHLVELILAAAVLAATGIYARTLWYGDPAASAAPEPVPTVNPAVLRAATTANACTRGGIALTFDDGPGLYTRPMLTVLRAYGVHATFFVIGAKAEAHPDLIRAEVADGHLIENHSWNHPHLSDLTVDQIHQQIDATQQAIEAAGAPAPTMLRPPFGDTSPTVDAQATRSHLAIVRWSLDTNDWRGRAPADITRAILDQLAPNQVVLMHDGVQQSRNTLAALPGVITGLRARGYCTITMPSGPAA